MHLDVCVCVCVYVVGVNLTGSMLQVRAAAATAHILQKVFNFYAVLYGLNGSFSGALKIKG